MMVSQRSLMRAAVLVVAMVPVAACARGPAVASPASHPTAHPLPSPLPTPTATAVRTATRTPPAFRPGDPTATPPGSEITDPNYLAGVEAYWSDDFSAVIPLMRAVLEGDPGLAPPHWYLGMASWSLGDCDTGLAEMEQALAIDPGYALAWADRGLMYLCLGNERQAVLDFETALSLDPSLAKVHNRLATLHYNHGEYDRALEEYDLTLAIDPMRAVAWNGRGDTLMQLGRYDECIESSTRAIDLDPELWEAYAGRGLCALAQEEYVGAVADYEVYVGAVPDDPTVWYNLGIAYRHAGNPQAAVAAYTHTLDLEPDYYQALINRGWARIDLEEYDEAVADFTAALEFGEIAAAYNGLGDVYLDQGLFEEAARNYERAMQLAPYDAYAYCRAPGAYFELGRYAEAIESAQMAVSIEPNCASDWYLLEVQGRSYYALGRYDEAIDYLTRALGRQDYMMGHYYRGIAYQAAGLKWQAAGDLRVFLAAARAYGYAGEEVADAELRMQLLGEE